MTDKNLLNELDSDVRAAINDVLPFEPAEELKEDTEIEESVEAGLPRAETDVERVEMDLGLPDHELRLEAFDDE